MVEITNLPKQGDCPDFGALVKSYRDKIGLSLDEAARAVNGYHRNWWWRIEKGKTKAGSISLETAKLMANICHCTRLERYKLLNVHNCHRKRFLILGIDAREREVQQMKQELNELNKE